MDDHMDVDAQPAADVAAAVEQPCQVPGEHHSDDVAMPPGDDVASDDEAAQEAQDYLLARALALNLRPRVAK